MQNNRKTYNEKYIPLVALIAAFVMLVSFLVALLKFPSVTTSGNDSSEDSSVIDEQISDDPSQEETSHNQSEDSNVTKDKETKYYKDLIFTNVSVSNNEIGNGCLAVINNGGKYTPSVKDENLVNFYAKKTPYKYDLSGVAIDIHEDAFAGYDALFVKYADSVGTPKIEVRKGYLSSGTASSGSLDLTTGYSVEINNIPDDKSVFLREQAYRYGVVQRYPTGKEQYTGYSADSTLYRYVGLGHSYYMNYYKFCIEEYLDKLKTEKIVEFASGIEDAIYVIYYVPANDVSNSTSIPVPTNENCTYSISGDGSEGFVVTVRIA